MSLFSKVRWKVQAVWSLARIARVCRNWPAVWAAWRGRGPVPELVLRSGYRVVPGPEDDIISLFQEIFLHEQYTAGFYRPRPGDTVLDVGANIGTFAVFLQHAAGGGVNVHCFEPGAETRRRLEHNVAVNDLGRSVRVYPVGVSDVARKLVLHGNRFAGSRSVLGGGGGTDGGEEIECVPLAEAVRRTGADRVDLLKIDVEGAEVDVLAEPDPGTWAKVQRVALEFHGSLRPGAKEAVTAALTAHGFRVHRVLAGSPDDPDGVLQAVR